MVFNKPLTDCWRFLALVNDHSIGVLSVRRDRGGIYEVMSFPGVLAHVPINFVPGGPVGKRATFHRLCQGTNRSLRSMARLVPEEGG